MIGEIRSIQRIGRKNILKAAKHMRWITSSGIVLQLCRDGETTWKTHTFVK